MELFLLSFSGPRLRMARMRDAPITAAVLQLCVTHDHDFVILGRAAAVGVRAADRALT
jgi:hypothetical protein